MRVLPSSLTVAWRLPRLTRAVSTGTGLGQRPAMIRPTRRMAPSQGSQRRTVCFWLRRSGRGARFGLFGAVMGEPEAAKVFGAGASFGGLKCANQVQVAEFAQDHSG